MLLLLTLLGACNGCQPRLPGGSNSNSRDDTHDPLDTGDSGETDTDTAVDSGPAPLCEVEEVEPNDSIETSQTLPMEEWACGGFQASTQTGGDKDFFQFTTSQAGWIELRGEAAARGSTANLMLALYDQNGENYTQVTSGYLTNDPRVVFPSAAALSYTMYAAEENSASGDDYTWWMIATQVKAPVEWDFEEPQDDSEWTDQNKTLATATEFPLDSTVFGAIRYAGDFDYYHVTTPDTDSVITFQVEAFAKGAPTDVELILRDASGTQIDHANGGTIDYDPDPYLQRRSTGTADWYVQLRWQTNPEGSTELGSPFRWYTLRITSTPSSG